MTYKFAPGTSFAAAVQQTPELSYLLAQWRAVDCRMEEIAAWSNKIFPWECELGHTWDTSPGKRLNGRNCPYCSNNKAWPGFNDLATILPYLLPEWDYERNAIAPQHVLPKSGKKVWWICPEAHPYQMSPHMRERGRGCPYCAGKAVWIGFNDLPTTHPHLLSEWDYEINTILPTEVTAGSNKKVAWKCLVNPKHKWFKNPHERTAPVGGNCPYCSRSKVSRGETDVVTTHPLLVKEWDKERNEKSLSDYISGSNYRASWKCEAHGHLWQTAISKRTTGANCPYCDGHKVWQGFNDLPTTDPQVSLEWDYIANGDKKPEHYSRGSNVKVYWICKSHGSYKCSILAKTKGSSCPKCFLGSTSKVEIAFRNELSNHLSDINKDHLAKIILPEYKRDVQVDILGMYKGSKIAIEYDGRRWHENKEQDDIKKTKALLKAGYMVVRIREGSLGVLDYSHSNFNQIQYNYSLSSTSIAAAVHNIVRVIDDFTK